MKTLDSNNLINEICKELNVITNNTALEAENNNLTINTDQQFQTEEIKLLINGLLRQAPKNFFEKIILPIENWSESTLDKIQFSRIYQQCTRYGKLDTFPVHAYLATVKSENSNIDSKIELEWAIRNIYVCLLLADIGKHEDKISLLCMRFRLAKNSKTHQWLWTELPTLKGLDLAEIVESLQSTHNKILKLEKAIKSHLPHNASKRIGEILLAYRTAADSKQKIDRPRESDEKSVQRISLFSDNSIAQLDLIVLPDEAKMRGVDEQEFINDTKKQAVLIDNRFNPLPGTESSLILQKLATSKQAAHIIRQDFRFPTDPHMIRLLDCQLIFEQLWQGVEKYDFVDAYLLLSILSSTPALECRKRFPKQGRNGNFFTCDLDIASFSLEPINKFRVNQLKSLHFAVPVKAYNSLSQEESITEEQLKRRVKELKEKLHIPRLSLGKFPHILRFIITRYISNHLHADFICSITPRHSPGLYYSTISNLKIQQTYAEAIKLLAGEIKPVDQDSFDQDPFDPDWWNDWLLGSQHSSNSCGSQITVTPKLVSAFFSELRLYILDQKSHIDKFNYYSIWLWHVVLLLTSCRPVNHAPGMLNQIDLKSRLLWLSDKEGRNSAANGRFLPVCEFLAQAIADYLSFLKQFYERYNFLGIDTFDSIQNIFNSSHPLINLFIKANNRQLQDSRLHLYAGYVLEPITPGLVKDNLEHSFPLPLNWTRHFGRYYLANKAVKTHLIDALFGHEAPNQEALHPFSSVPINELKSVADIYQQMAIELKLEGISLK
ncbi:MAG: hypothetical protein KGO49_09235 [Gammaproteobacteria bacterium]|nr:hypothetical protein [Gammaproteobacteria bacterium]